MCMHALCGVTRNKQETLKNHAKLHTNYAVALYSFDLFRLSKHKFKIKFCKAYVCAIKPIDQAYPEMF